MRSHLILAASILFALVTSAQAQTIKVGMVSIMTGPDKSLGDNVDKAVSLYTKLHGSDLPSGVKIEIIKRDETSPPNPTKVREVTDELLKKEKVQFLTGAIYTPSAMAMSQFSAENKIPFFIMNAGGSGVTGRSPYIVRFSFTLWQSAYPLGQWAGNKYKTAYTVVSDFTPGHEAENAFSKGFEEAGGKILGRSRVQVAKPDFTESLKAAKDMKPEAVFSFVPGGFQASKIMKTFGELGLKQSGIKFLGTGDIVTDEELPNMGEVPLGTITAHHYSTTADRPSNKDFLAAWRKEYGASSIPSFMSVAAWDAMAAIYYCVIEQKGKVEADKTLELMKHYKSTTSPRGPFHIDPETRDIVQNEYIRETKKVNGVMSNVEFETFSNIKDPWKANH